MKRKMTMAISIALIASCISFASCVKGPKVNTDPNQPAKQALTGDDILRGAKTFGQVLGKSLDQGITLEAELAANGTIEPANEPDIRRWLADGKKATEDFNTRLLKYDHFDAASKADIANFLEEAIGFIDRLNNEGILRIKNPRSQLIASGMLLGASTAVTIYKSTFDQVK